MHRVENPVEGLDEKIYCPASEIRQTPPLNVIGFAPGARVEFTVAIGDKGLRAKDIDLVKPAARFNLTLGGRTVVRAVYAD